NWFFSFGIDVLLEDPNAVVAIYPIQSTDADNEYFKPFTFVYESDQVIEYQDNNLAVLLSRDKSIVQVGQTKVREGRILYLFDKDEVVKIEQTGRKEDFEFVETLRF